MIILELLPFGIQTSTKQHTIVPLIKQTFRLKLSQQSYYLQTGCVELTIHFMCTLHIYYTQILKEDSFFPKLLTIQFKEFII